MTADFNHPNDSDYYEEGGGETSVLEYIREMFTALAKMELASVGSIPTGAVQFVTASNKFQRYGGSSWSDVVLSVAGGGTGRIDISSEKYGYLSGVTSDIQAQLNAKSDIGHTHDGRYYTETEIDSALSGKSNVGHSHYLGLKYYENGAMAGYGPLTVASSGYDYLELDLTGGNGINVSLGWGISPVSWTISADFAGNGSANTVARSDHTHSYIPTSEKGSNNGVAELNATGLVPSSQLPSFVDDVLEYASLSAFPGTGESSKIYVARDTNKTYRWGGSSYTEISQGVVLGETSATAYRGDRGKTAYDHSQNSSIHLSSSQKTDLTDGGNSSAHYHSSDRAWSNITGKPSSFIPASHGNEAHSSTFITSSGVTKEVLDGNSDVEDSTAGLSDTDDKLPTSSAVKNYVDNNSGGGGGGIDVPDSFIESGSLQLHKLNDLNSDFSAMAFTSGTPMIVKDRYVIIGGYNSSDTNYDEYLFVYDMDTENLHRISTGSAGIRRPTPLIDPTGGPVTEDSDYFYIVGEHAFRSYTGGNTIGRVNATDSDPDNWTVVGYGGRRYSSKTPGCIKNGIIYFVSFYVDSASIVRKLHKFDTSDNSFSTVDLGTELGANGISSSDNLYKVMDVRNSNRILIEAVNSTSGRYTCQYDVTTDTIIAYVVNNSIASTHDNGGFVECVTNGGGVGYLIPHRENATAYDVVWYNFYQLDSNVYDASGGGWGNDNGIDFSDDENVPWVASFVTDGKVFGHRHSSSNYKGHPYLDLNDMSVKIIPLSNIGDIPGRVNEPSDLLYTLVTPKSTRDGRRACILYTRDNSASSYNNNWLRQDPNYISIFEWR